MPKCTGVGALRSKKRSAIPCFWENQLSGCQKGNCAFHHTKGRYVDGVYIPPSKTQIAKPEPSEMDIQISQTPSKLTAASTTHLHGVKTKEAAENVPSPTHPPVVINATDDDEDDDGVISTLNVQECSSNPVIIEKNITVGRTVMFSKNDPPDIHRNLSQRLGKRKVFTQESPSAVSGGESFPAVKKTLSERLGKKMISPVIAPDAHHKKIQVPRLLKNRLGLPTEQNSTETEKAANPTTDFHIKTLQEIQKEKASQRQEQQLKCRSIKSEDHFCLKSHIFIKPQPDIHVKSLHEIQAEKKLRQLNDGKQKDENKVDKTDCRVGRDLHTNQNFEEKNLPELEKKQGGQAGIIWNRFCERGIKPSHLTDIVPSSSVSLKETKAISQPVEKVQIKTLEEIRKKTAVRIKHNRQATNTEVIKSVSQPQVKSRHKRILRLSKPQVSKETDQDTNSQTNNAATAADAKTTVNFETPVSTLVKITEKVGSDKTFGIQSLNNAAFTDTQKISQHEVGCSVKPSKIILVNKSKVMKKQSPAKTILKQKAQQSSPVAEVKPMKTTVTSTDKERTTDLLSTAESLVSQHVRSTSPKLLKESSQVPASDPGHSGTAPTVVKSRRASIASLGKPSSFTEDDFDELIWDISDGKLDDEIDLDPSKDEDDLLMELSEMIDS